MSLGKRERFPVEMCEEGIFSLENAQGNDLPRLMQEKSSHDWPKAVGLGKGKMFQSELIPDAKLPRREATESRESTRFFSESIQK